MTQNYKVAVLGGGVLALAALDFLLEKQVEIAIITSPRHANNFIDGVKFGDRIKTYTDTILVVDSLDTDQADTILQDSDLSLSFASPWIFRKRHIEKSGSIINFHLTELPKFGGGAEASWQLMSNYRRSALTIHLVDEGVDTGSILVQKLIDWPQHFRKPSEIKSHNESLSIPHIESFIEDRLQGIDFPAKPQNPKERIYFPRLSTSIHGYINWNWNGEHIYRFIQAFDDPYTGAVSRVNDSDDLYSLRNPKVEETTISMHPFMSGLIIRMEDERYFIACHDLLISVTIDSVGNKNKNGVRLGDRMTNRHLDIERALTTRVIYRP